MTTLSAMPTAFGIGPLGMSKAMRPVPQPVPYSREWVAGCYGVTVNDPCPQVTVEIPDWADQWFTQREIVSRIVVGDLSDLLL